MNKQQLANKIWESANKMRSKIEANEYKDYILGFIFYKYLSDYEVKFLKENDYDDELLKTVIEDDFETVEWVQKNIGYFISYDNLFATWLSKGKDFDVSNVTDALSAFSRLISPTHKKVFDKIFQTLDTGLSKLGDSSGARTKAIGGLLDLIKDIPMDGRQGYDVLGFIYEYLISMFAANAGKKAGEFYTPHEVSVLMSEIVADHLKGKNEIKIFDPTSGSGSLLINIGQSVAKHMKDSSNIKYYAQELKENTYNLTRMNLVMRGIKPDNIVTRNGDTLEEDWPYFDESDPSATYDPLYVDAVVSNPPYSQPWDPVGKDNDPRYARFGIAPKTKADYAFLLHDLYHIKPDGIMTIVLPHGVLFRGGEEGEIRKNLIENNHIDTVIGLPANIFFGTGIPTIVMVLRQKRENTDVLIVDASKGFVKEGKNNKLRLSDIKKIADTVKNRENTPKFSRCVTKEEIRENEYNLNIPRYVDSSEKAESWDIYASMFGGMPVSEINELYKFWEAFPSLRNSLFTDNGTPYADLATNDIKNQIKTHENIVSFQNDFNNNFATFSDYLQSELIQNVMDVNISKQELVIAEDIFSRLVGIPLIDKYNAFQLLADNWQTVENDLEIIQTEGFSATKQVDPNMILKKKNGADAEVQDGYIGHIMPFDLVQKVHLKAETNFLKAKENELSEIPSLYEEVLDTLSEDEKEMDILNEEKDAFDLKKVTSKIKTLKSNLSDDEKDLKAKLIKAENISKREKELKSAIKKDSAELHLKTKETIENLTDSQVNELLHFKWNTPLCQNLFKLTDNIIAELIAKIEAIMNKYTVTYLDTQNEIASLEKDLSSMLDNLTGNDFDMKGLAEFKALLGVNQ
ncbi:MAG: type I restriction-modification system subunit M [Clostridia bacterium]